MVNFLEISSNPLCMSDALYNIALELTSDGVEIPDELRPRADFIVSSS